MCGIVGAVAQRDVADILLEGLKRLEYRGYDSAGLAIISPDSQLLRQRRLGKVQALADAVAQQPMAGGTGIAHTRWATHGEPSEANAHPHVSGDIAVVHNGIIENHEALRDALKAQGYVFTSQTDTEVIAHLVQRELKSTDSLLSAVMAARSLLHGAYGMVVIDRTQPERMIVARSGSPLVIGFGIGEHFVASDQLALLPVTRKFAFLEEGDVAEITRLEVNVFDEQNQPVERTPQESTVEHDAGDKGEFRHYMLKEIYEQPQAIINTLEGRLFNGQLNLEVLGDLSDIDQVQIIACGTSYHAGMTARYWIEDIAGVACNVEIASEFRYRRSVVRPNSLLVTISQSGETADTLAALRLAKELGFSRSLTICNVPGSSLVRESDMALMTRAGAEIGVASTKAFTTQLVALLLLTAALGKGKGMDSKQEKRIADALTQLPAVIEKALKMNDAIETLAEYFAEKNHALFLGRGDQYPIAMEGALKLKEISYIHAEAYAAGELKHGPLALIDAEMPIVVVAPQNDLVEKLKSNIEEVRARGGELYIFADEKADIRAEENMQVMDVPHCADITAPILYTLPLQLLSYHVAIIKGTDVDQPRNLAKSVTVE
ncbi:MAG: glutamine--fructose-6-phosphate transaminase (isomerizing) [Oceanospirillaceae bacterium]|uniref:glutamine--fructose-6-phosphate transaminase (isomerizing) n=1 Tax=unclassified Thalassolituus TaxID=2624967 RepID=UPI000C681999|nr:MULTISPECIES: glutamine--fructose-6-phosphate transaminase (isomerizing) [unclassified Thalassolituus]MAY01217.1 glutamine--fructose-6-phosphate transaminase (isomerizing) [Oceanospirillaceae bacterium]MBL33335.1 glutamine--fructose-6-phosphate transaminase (isomerizing) [Oceanospirillaceae bacterium]MBS55066.1 glutamine--fructose-6-phosphate transaminase (isomerizing) [Oceanospirillaceae bacterium]